MTNDQGDDQSHTYNRNWLVDNVYQMIRLKPKSDVILLKMNSGNAWFADASVNGTSFMFLMDTGTSKSVMSVKQFLTISELFRPTSYNMKMKFQVANREVTASMGVAHIIISMYSYTFNLRSIGLSAFPVGCTG